MFFQTAGIEVQPWVPPLVAFSISFFTSMGGVSGAFLLLPFQISFLGYTAPSASATNQLFNIVAIPSGVYRYWKEGRMVWPLTWIVIAGTLPGVLLGAIVRIKYLPDPKQFKIFAATVLLYIGLRMIRDLIEKNWCRNQGSERKTISGNGEAASGGRKGSWADRSYQPIRHPVRVRWNGRYVSRGQVPKAYPSKSN